MYFRSEVVFMYKIYFPIDSIYNCLVELGELGLVQFLNNKEGSINQTNSHMKQIADLDVVEKKLENMRDVIKENNIKIKKPTLLDKFLKPNKIIQLTDAINQLMGKIEENQQNLETFKDNRTELLETNDVVMLANSALRNNSAFVKIRTILKDVSSDDKEKNPSREVEDFKLGYYAGTMPRQKYIAFEKVLWRVFHGNYYLETKQINDSNDPNVRNNAFIVFFHGDTTKNGIKKLLQGFNAKLYQMPEEEPQRYDLFMDINTKLNDLKRIQAETEDEYKRNLKYVAANLEDWLAQIKKLKAIYHTLNQMNEKQSETMHVARVWIPRDEIHLVQDALNRGSARSDLKVPPLIERVYTTEIPPTYIKSNKFIEGFQVLIDAYGIPSYRELNPAPYTIISFPFLFAMMFGDVGHGILLLLAAIFMIRIERKGGLSSRNEIVTILYGGRYVILLMAIYSIYVGSIYNDTFGKPMNIFPSRWKVNFAGAGIYQSDHLTLDPAVDVGASPPEYGLDTAWLLAQNKIIFINSYKMKISIIFGVLQMFFGLTLSAVNHKYFHNPMYILLEDIPQMVFLICLFGYLCVLVIFKWWMYAATNPAPYSAGCAPAILILFIDMMLFKPEQPAKHPDCEYFMYPGQGLVQKILVVIALLMIPIIFLGKPLYLMYKLRNEPQRNSSIILGDGQISSEFVKHQLYEYEKPRFQSSKETILPKEHHEKMSEIIIHQGIKTLESVLGTISHTASYLRLWALSLAHSQLTEVMWMMIFHRALVIKNVYAAPIVIFFIFAIWAVLNVVILVIMEGLSAFLHTLRLHWVEFQSKFYSGEGYKFMPFSFRAILKS